MNGRDQDHHHHHHHHGLCGRSPVGREQRVRTEPRPRDRDRQPQRQNDQRPQGRNGQRPQGRNDQSPQGRGNGVRWWQRQPASTQPTSSQPASSQPRHCMQLLYGGKPEMVVVQDNRALSRTIAADGYQLGATVGHGSYSKVRVAVRLATGEERVQRLACKVIDKRRRETGAGGGGGGGGTSTYVRKFLPRELDVLRAIRHPNVVRTHRIYVAPSSVLVFMDYCELGDLLGHLQRAKSVPQWQAHMFFKQICDAVDYLHQNDISHRDIKCENVLLENARHVKLTDFGFARMCDDERGRPIMSQTYCGSSLYAAPEVLQGIPYDPKASDVWALGVVLYVMLADCMPYPQANRQQIVAHQIGKKLNKPKKCVSQEALKLVKIILEPDVTKRATVYQVRRHQWVNQPNPYQYTLTH